MMLDGVTVVSIEQAVAAPFASRQLADLGARVIKVERPDGGDFARGYDHHVLGESSFFVWLNRGKESLAADLKDPDDLALVDRIIASADVVIQNLAPGAAERLGLGAARLRERHPRLITCTITGYGASGPYRDKKAYDLLVQCEAGLLEVTGTETEPAKVGISIADIATGMYGYSAVLAALYARERSGVGAELDIAMIDALGEWMSQPVNQAIHSGHAPRRTGARHASIAPYGPYSTADGVVFLGVQNNREWARLAEQVLASPNLVTDPRFAANPDRVAHNRELTSIIEARLKSVSAEEALALLDQAGIASARVRTPGEFAEHPQLTARDRWRDVVTPAGTIQALLPPVIVAGATAAMGAVPALGQHTVAIRSEFSP
ncbi:CaiB/BaiF CoA-transferase family protein [Jatrophihabitans sp.]|uniref:CaiB/BaiF CoA transferase family protein n=1 Tax=Jatrophihabitans sp. TaxID=1932789 RepID=UPI0030C7777B|nr:L-carnitine dehydratase/bile acid-inducible protein [Jatrophihabitans sp.]